MAETLGSLVDKLSIVNLKLWHVQDRLQAAARQNQDLPASDAAALVSLNQERNKLATEIDRTLALAIESGKVTVDPRHKF